MANQDRVNFIWGENALTTIPPVPVSEIAYRDTTQTPEQMAEGQKYDTIYNSARYNQMFYLVTAVAKTLCENGMMPFLAGQAYAHYARCIYTDGKIYVAQRAIEADESPFPTPGDESNVWLKEGGGGGGGNPAGSVIPFYSVNLGGPDNRNPIFWGQSEPDTGWLICDGGSDGRGGSVPDLREKFIMGADGVDDAGQTGGADSATPTISVQSATQGGKIGDTDATGTVGISKTGISTQGTTLNESTLPWHSHAPSSGQAFVLADSSASVTWSGGGTTKQNLNGQISATGNSQAHAHGVNDWGHTHTFSGTDHTHTFTGTAHDHKATANAINIIPPYYKMVFCVKLPE